MGNAATGNHDATRKDAHMHMTMPVSNMALSMAGMLAYSARMILRRDGMRVKKRITRPARSSRSTAVWPLPAEADDQTLVPKFTTPQFCNVFDCKARENRFALLMLNSNAEPLEPPLTRVFICSEKIELLRTDQGRAPRHEREASLFGAKH